MASFVGERGGLRVPFAGFLVGLVVASDLAVFSGLCGREGGGISGSAFGGFGC